MKKRVLIFCVGLLFFLSFIWFTFIVKSKVLDGFDFNTTVRLQNHTPHTFDTYFSYLSLFGSFEIIGLIIIGLILFRKKILSIFSTTLFFGFAHIIEIVGKAFLHHNGPPVMFFRYNMPFFFPSTYVQPGYSYPSGHSLRITFLSIIIIFIIIISKKMSFVKKILFIGLCLCITFLTLYSRVTLGEHWTTDVIGGVLLGISCGLFSISFL